MSKNNWASYLAGFIDGEGNIGIDKYNKNDKPYLNYGIKVAISNTNLALLERIKSQFGGYISTLKQKKPNHQICFQFCVRHRKAYSLLGFVFPYLIIKKELAKVAMRMSKRINEDRYDHKKPKPISRQIKETKDYELWKSLMNNNCSSLVIQQ